MYMRTDWVLGVSEAAGELPSNDMGCRQLTAAGEHSRLSSPTTHPMSAGRVVQNPAWLVVQPGQGTCALCIGCVSARQPLLSLLRCHADKPGSQGVCPHNTQTKGTKHTDAKHKPTAPKQTTTRPRGQRTNGSAALKALQQHYCPAGSCTHQPRKPSTSHSPHQRGRAPFQGPYTRTSNTRGKADTQPSLQNTAS